jgi:hypothetical protein
MSRRNHFYMVAALVTYLRDGATKQRHLNIVMQSPEKNITASPLNQARLTLIQRLYQEADVHVEDLRDFVFLGFSYLGHMTDKEFNDMDTEPAVQKNFPRNIYDA